MMLKPPTSIRKFESTLVHMQRTTTCNSSASYTHISDLIGSRI
jgi:hypothetical protein